MGQLLRKDSFSSAYVLGVASSTTGPLKIFAYVGSVGANEPVSKVKMFAVPYGNFGDADQENSPFNDSTIMAGVPEFDFDNRRLVVLGDQIVRAEDVITSDPTGTVRMTSMTSRIFNESESKDLRVFSRRLPSLEGWTPIPLSSEGSVDTLLPHHRYQNIEPFERFSMTRGQDGQTVEVTGLPADKPEFFNSNLSGTVIPGATGQSPVKVLVFSGNALGIITLPAKGGGATFAGPFAVAGLSTDQFIYDAAISRINNQTKAYLAVSDTPTILSIDLTTVMANPPQNIKLTSTVLVDARKIADAKFFKSLIVKDNFLHGFLIKGEMYDSGTLMSRNLNSISAQPTFYPMNVSLTKDLPDETNEFFPGWVFAGIRVATESDKGRTVPYLYSTLYDGSILEIRMTSTSSSLADLTYRLRPEGGALTFGPAPLNGILVGNSFYGTTYSGQLVVATKEQISRSYIRSKTLPSEFSGAKRYLNPALQTGRNLRAGDFGDRIGRNPRRVKSGTSFVNCPGFEAKVLRDGNFVVQKILNTGAAPVVVWRAINSPSKPVPGSYLEFNANGRVALLKPDRTVAWNAGTAGKGAMTLNMQQDGNLVVYAASAKPVWDSRGCLHGKCNATNALVPSVCEK